MSAQRPNCMSRIHLTSLLLVGALALPAQVFAEAESLAGRVTNRSSPLAAATVYACNQTGQGFFKVATDTTGRFSFAGLSAGLFRVIAHKPGFLPAVVLVTRTSAQASQHLELHLQKERLDDVRTGESFWTLREQIPSDVLRDIQATEIDFAGQQEDLRLASTGFNTEVLASTGISEGGGAPVQTTIGRLGVNGRLGDLQFDLESDFEKRDLSNLGEGAGMPATGELSAFSLALTHRNSDRLDISTLSSQFEDGAEGDLTPRDFEQHRVAWQKSLGKRSSSSVSAQYTSENNFYRSGATPKGVADASRTLNVEGSWLTRFGESFNFETGLRYREQLGLDTAGEETFEDQWLQAFGRGDWQLKPAVLVEYGLYTSLRDGTLSLVPRGGLLLRLGPDWQLGGRASYRLAETEEDWSDPVGMRSAVYGGASPCEAEQESCYQVFVSRMNDDGGEFQLGAVHREFGETLRLYFDENLFQYLDSVFLVEGDQLPEIQVAMSRHVTPRILASLRSSVGEGGGGLVYLTGDKPHTNDIRYLMASLDTRFKATSTGLFLSFHHLEQDFDPVGSNQASVPRVDLDRLELMLSQDLNVLADLAGEWAVQLNLELRRESTPMEDFVLEEDPELERRLMGGIAVRF